MCRTMANAIVKKMALAVLLVLFVPSTCLADTTAVVTVNAIVQPGESALLVDTNSVGFGIVMGSVNNRRFVAGPVNVTYFAGTSPWTIMVYTVNSDGVPGLIGVSDPSKSIPLKVWCGNYGPWEHRPGVPPDEENPYFWNGHDFNGDGDKEDVIRDGSISEIILGFDVNGDGDALDIGLGTQEKPILEEPCWLRIPDYTQMDHTNPYTWRRLLTSEWVQKPGPGGGPADPYTFPVYFAIDVTGVAPQDYRTTALRFELINE